MQKSYYARVNCETETVKCSPALLSGYKERGESIAKMAATEMCSYALFVAKQVHGKSKVEIRFFPIHSSVS